MLAFTASATIKTFNVLVNYRMPDQGSGYLGHSVSWENVQAVDEEHAKRIGEENLAALEPGAAFVSAEAYLQA